MCKCINFCLSWLSIISIYVAREVRVRQKVSLECWSSALTKQISDRNSNLHCEVSPIVILQRTCPSRSSKDVNQRWIWSRDRSALADKKLCTHSQSASRTLGCNVSIFQAETVLVLPIGYLMVPCFMCDDGEGCCRIRHCESPEFHARWFFPRSFLHQINNHPSFVYTSAILIHPYRRQTIRSGAQAKERKRNVDKRGLSLCLVHDRSQKFDDVYEIVCTWWHHTAIFHRVQMPH